jgi:hypothetical protein
MPVVSLHQFLLAASERAQAYEVTFPPGRLPPGLAPTVTSIAPESETYATLVEATTCVVRHGQEKWGLAVQRAFDTCLTELNMLVDGYAQTVQDLQAGQTNRSTIPRFAPAILIDPVSRRLLSHGVAVTVVPDHRAAVPPDLSDTQMNQMIQRASLSAVGEPYTVVRQWERAAYRYFHLDGDYAAAAIAIHTAGEVFFDALLLRMMWEELYFQRSVATAADVAKLLFDSSLRGRLRTQYPRRLDGGWDPEQQGHPLWKWEMEVSRLRNRVAHGGYYPSEAETIAAFLAERAIEPYVLQLLSTDQNRTKYPLTLAMMLGGQPGLEKLGLYTGKVKRAVEAMPPKWVLLFYAFRQDVLDLMWGV